MLNAGFQYLEQRDANDTITKDGVVGKNSPFATSDNSGIYDIIAEDLRWLKENVDDVKDTSDLEAIKQSVTDMYNDMKNNSSFGEAAAKAQAEEAKKQAQVALESATNAKTYHDEVMAKSTEINDTVAEIKAYIEKAQALIESNKELEQTLGSYVTVASNKAKVASDSAEHAATSETNAAASEAAAADSAAKAKASEENLGTHEANAATSASNAATSAENAKTSETNAKASETNAKASETNSKTSESNAKTSETNASNSADLAKAWAESSGSPDSVNDTDSTTGKTQSSKTWALYSRDRAISAFNSETSASTSASNAANSESSAKTSESSAATSAEHASASAENASTSETKAKTSEVNAKTSETNAKASETNAATSAENAATSEGNTKGYMEKAQAAYESAKAIQSVVDVAKADAEKCVADVEAVKESLAKMITYQGSVDNYSDLPTNPQVGYSYNVKNADKTHGVNAGDNLVWNGEDWDNFGGAIDMNLFAELGKDVKFNTVTATLNGNASTATKLQTARSISLTGNATGAASFDGSGDANISVTVNKSKHAAAADAVKSDSVTETSTVARPVWLSYENDNTRQVTTDNLTYTPSTKTLTAANFEGHLAGNADSATNADTVDGVHASSMFYNKGFWGDDFWTTMGSFQVNNVSITGGAYERGQVISIPTNSARFQLYSTDNYGGNGRLHYRTGWDDNEHQWNTILDNENYNLFAPTKTGGGASGTWGINITGNAATAATADNAKKLGGYALNTESTGGHFGTIPKVGTDGVMEVGKYIDWHSQNGGSADYTSRWEAQNNGTVTVGTINGTLNGNAATATKALNVPTSDVGGNIWIS